jgi:hypothetical protein
MRIVMAIVPIFPLAPAMRGLGAPTRAHLPGFLVSRTACLFRQQDFVLNAPPV